jgi:hypothetical protein
MVSSNGTYLNLECAVNFIIFIGSRRVTILDFDPSKKTNQGYFEIIIHDFFSHIRRQEKSKLSGRFRKAPHNPSTFRWGIQAGWAKPIFF